MKETDRVWIGADPGGESNFGIAILLPNGGAEICCADYVDQAIDFVCRHVTSCPAGVGVDAPLWWTSGAKGLRAADQWLRDRYDLPSKNVQATNSMWGSVLVQGAMFVQRIRERFPGVNVTETHPKAVMKAFGNGTWQDFSTRFPVNAQVSSEHERDAVIAAVAAREGFEGRWTHDLGKQRFPSEQDPATHHLAPVFYFWPE